MLVRRRKQCWTVRVFDRMGEVIMLVRLNLCFPSIRGFSWRWSFASFPLKLPFFGSR